MSVGEAGYLAACEQIVGAAKKLADRIRESSILAAELEIIGNPMVSVVAFQARNLDIYDIADGMSAKGWHLNALQNPPSMHVAVTMPVVKVWEMQLTVSLEETLSTESKQISFQVPQYDASGRHVSNTTKSLNVKIPAGVADGERIRLKGQGAPGIGGGANGDLYLIIKFAPHSKFEVEGENLVITLPLAPWELALGAEVAVPTLTGKINLKVPAGSQNGQRMRAKGHGLLNKAGERGFLYIQLKAVMPKQADDETIALWQELAKKAAFNPREHF